MLITLVFQKDDLILDLRRQIVSKDKKIAELDDENLRFKNELKKFTSPKEIVKKCRDDLEQLKKQMKKGKCL